MLSKNSWYNVLTVPSHSESHQLESVVHISPPEWRLCTARERKLSRHHKAHCVSRTCKLSWRRSVQRGPKRGWVFTLQSVHCLSAHFTQINATHQLSPSATDSIFTCEQNFFLRKWCSTFFPLEMIFIYLVNQEKKNGTSFFCLAPSLLFWHLLYSQAAQLKMQKTYCPYLQSTRKLQKLQNGFVVLSYKVYDIFCLLFLHLTKTMMLQ